MTFDDYLRYVQQQASPEEAGAVRAWMADPSNAPLAQEWLNRYAELLEQEEGAAAEMPEFEAIQARLMAQLGLAPALPAQRRLSRWPRWAAAAVLLSSLLTGAWLWHSAHRLPPLTTVATANREQRTVLLPDGSTVQLNGHSTLRYAADLGQQPTREVWMEGEGYFSVKHLPDHRRFIVHTSAGFNVEVLGTTFTVYRRRAQARVVLLTGQVRVDFAAPTRSKQVLLKPGELLETQDDQPRRIAHQKVDAALYAAWTKNKLAFNETSLADVATRLSDTYGVAITLANPALAQYRVTGTFPIGKLETMLQFLEKSFPLTIQRQPNHFIISAHTSSLSQ